MLNGSIEGYTSYSRDSTCTYTLIDVGLTLTLDGHVMYGYGTSIGCLAMLDSIYLVHNGLAVLLVVRSSYGIVRHHTSTAAVYIGALLWVLCLTVRA